jgi:methyl coenzyme M reductase subunit C
VRNDAGVRGRPREASSLNSPMSLLARSVLRTAAQQPAVAAPAQARNMATLREIELRLKSVRNIEKITKVGLVDMSSGLNRLNACYSR